MKSSIFLSFEITESQASLLVRGDTHALSRGFYAQQQQKVLVLPSVMRYNILIKVRRKTYYEEEPHKN